MEGGLSHDDSFETMERAIEYVENFFVKNFHPMKRDTRQTFIGFNNKCRT